MSKRFQTPELEDPLAELEASHRRTRQIVEGLRDAFMSVDADWRITDCNARAEAILGRSRAQLVGHTLWTVIGVAPESPLGESARRVMQTGEAEESELSLNVGGVERLLSVRGFPLDAGVGVVAGDITELRLAERRLAESEARFRELANGAPAPTWMTAADGKIEYLNTAMLHVLERSAEELMGRGWQRHMHPDDRPAFRRALRKAQAGHSRFVSTPRVRRGDGAWRTLEVTGVPRFDAHGAFSGHVGMATDITEVLAAKRRQAMLINELNHRVKNTLATVQSIVRQTMKETPAAKETFELLTDRLMALAAAHDVLARESWEGAELAEMVGQALRPFGSEGPRITVSGPKVRLDPGAALALFLAIYELGTNAVRHGALSTSEGRVSLHWAKHDDAVDLEWRESGGPRVTPPTREGLGTRLLGRGLASELGAPAQMIYAPDGLVCRIHARAVS